MRLVALWIDARCINQKDDVEKSSQVQMMGSIYRKATKVVVWLGPERDDSGFAMNLVKELANPSTKRHVQQELAKMAKEPHLVKRREIIFEKLIADIGFNNARSIDAMHDLFHRAWWKRLWVLQELVLAEYAVMVCGIHIASWLEFHSSLQLIMDLLEAVFEYPKWKSRD